jgi:hypothetical protein
VELKSYKVNKFPKNNVIALKESKDYGGSCRNKKLPNKNAKTNINSGW